MFSFQIILRAAFAAVSAALLFGAGPAAAESAARGADTLGLIEAYYQEGDGFRAETEVLRFLAAKPSHPRRAEVELVRAKLFYREGRHAESSLMLFSQLDRFPRSPAARQAGRLLAFSLIREGRLDEAEPWLRRGGTEEPAPSLGKLRAMPEGAISPGAAVAWSTWLPGTGFFVLDQPGKAFAAIGVNLFFLAAAAASFNSDLPGPGLIFLLAELAIYRGGRNAVRDAAEAQIARARRGQTERWLQRQGEAKLLSVGLRLPLGSD